MQKVLFFSLLLIATCAKPMDKLKPEDRAAAQDRIRTICYVLGYIGSNSFAGTASSDPFVRKQSSDLEEILQQNDIPVPQEKNFDWLEALRKKLSTNSD